MSFPWRTTGYVALVLLLALLMFAVRGGQL